MKILFFFENKWEMNMKNNAPNFTELVLKDYHDL